MTHNAKPAFVENSRKTVDRMYAIVDSITPTQLCMRPFPQIYPCARPRALLRMRRARGLV